MAAPEFLAETVRTAISSHQASASTVTTLQSLLSSAAQAQPASETKSGPIRRNGTTSRTQPTSKTAKPTKTGRTAQPGPGAGDARRTDKFEVLEDEARSLPPKARFALATDVVNSTLKVLVDATKSQSHAQTSRRSSPVKHQATPRRTASISQRALQIRSGNATPIQGSPTKQSEKARRDSQCSNAAPNHAGYVLPTAECSRLAFSYLRSVDPKKLGVRELPHFQLENGMISLCGKLINLGLHSLAAKELVAVKRRLKLAISGQDEPKSAKVVSTMAQNGGKNDQLADLLDLGIGVEACPNAWPLLASYHLHVLRLIAVTHKPAAIEGALRHFAPESHGSVVHLALRWCQREGEKGKAIKHLDSLSQVMLQLCPGVSESADAAAKDRTRTPSPLAVFEIQAISLHIRREACKHSGHAFDFEKDLTEPFSRCLHALLRRLPSGNASGIFEICNREYERLHLSADSNSGNSTTSFAIISVLCTLAERASSTDQACNLAQIVVKQCQSLDPAHARLISAISRKLSVKLAMRSSQNEDASCGSDVEAIIKGLQGTVTGSVSDYETLLFELSHLLHASSRAEERSILQKQFAGLAAGFASRYVRKFPGKHLDTAQDIIRSSLAFCGSNDDAVDWVSKDAAHVLIQSGVLRIVADKASAKSMPLVWTSCNKVISFGRILKILMSKAVKSDSTKCMNFLLDDEALDPAERGALLERQLKCQLDLARKPKHHEALQRLLPETLKKLAKTYNASSYPIRRARVAALAIRVREEYPTILLPHVLSILSNTTLDVVQGLGKDEGLRPYLLDIQAALRVSRAFVGRSPQLEDISQSLADWKSVLNDAQDVASIELVIDTPSALISQLICLDEYFGMLGNDQARIPILQIMLDACRRTGIETLEIGGLLRLARVYLLLGYAEKAAEPLEMSEALVKSQPSYHLERLDHDLCRAEYLFAVGHLDDCQHALQDTLRTRADLQPYKLPLSQVTAFRLLQGRAWLLYSRYTLASGSSSEALYAAKRASKVFNSIWSAIERSSSQSLSNMDQVQTDEPSMDKLASKVSKLNLKPASGNSETSISDQSPPKGALFWPVVRLLCSCLLHLCDVYTHHGIFFDASYASESAIRTAEAVGADQLVQRIRFHRAILLAVSGRLEEAELCIAQEEDDNIPKVSLAKVEQLKARSVLSVKHGDLQLAYGYLVEAASVVKTLQAEKHCSSVDTLSKLESADTEVGAIEKVSRPTKKKETRSNAGTKTASRGRSAPTKSTKMAASVAEAPQNLLPGDCSYVILQNLASNVTINKAMIGLALGRGDMKSIEFLEQLAIPPSDRISKRRIDYECTMQKIVSALQTDFSLNVLPESTLAYPSLQRTKGRLSALLNPSPLAALAQTKQISKGPTSQKGTKRKPADSQSLEILLCTARRCLLLEPQVNQLMSTTETHRHCTQLSSVSMMLSATSMTNASGVLHPVQEGYTVERARIHAAECQRTGVMLERDAQISQDPMAWPGQEPIVPKNTAVARSFQSDYIDILPASWTAVSLSMDEKCDELLVARYDRSEDPFLVRLPFSRQKSEDTDEDIFDFHTGKEELHDIIELSNYSCHNAAESGAKGGKTIWWSQREALDIRLHELLLNMENLWLGGFKGVFSQHHKDHAHMSRFRKAFEGILDRHLPSRKAAKRDSKKVQLDDHILNLFIGLAKGLDGDEDLDEPLADLLYFVVDIFQFNGERNAYDEIDFDSMGIETLDAIRTYNDALENDDSLGNHLILVLDRRLQAFPWESLPCLEGCSVSRVDSMLSIRERILQMRQSSNLTDEQYNVNRGSGTYILNPSSDLKATETTLAPELARLGKSEGSEWTSIVGQEPSEAEFKEGLQSSTTMLYFGHGAGIQYIRPRTIRRLESCSEVVWLMGCSSGAVTEYGELEPFAVPLAYLLVGQEKDMATVSDSGNPDREVVTSGRKCMAVVGMLWDVTDKDIDRFSLAVGEEWGLWKPAEEATKLPARTPRKREKLAAPSTPEKASKPPKTPKVRKTPAPARTPARSRSRARQGEMKKQSLSEAVSKSRDSCYLRYLNGAAPVVYGVPVYLGD